MNNGVKALRIETNTASYPIYIGHHLNPLSLVGDLKSFNKALIVTDDIVSATHLASFNNNAALPDTDTLVLPHGEESKSIETMLSILDKLVAQNFHRDDLMIAFGGGVVGDMGALAASLFHRGMRLWQFPTTLLAQVDSAVGGKTAVNYGGVKNSVGTFYQPEAVFCDLSYLNSLSERAYLSAFAEVIKCALLSADDFFQYIDEQSHNLRGLDPQALQQVVLRCCAIKAAIVSQDEKEQGVRALLNLGHTFAHAIESYTDYRRYYHGEAVAIGLVLAAQLSQALGYLGDNSVNLITSLLQKFDLPVSLPTYFDIDSLLSLLKHDKKVRQSKVRFVLLNSIGDAFVDSVCDQGLLRNTLLNIKSTS